MNISTESNRTALTNAVGHLEESANAIAAVIESIREHFGGDGKIEVTADELTFISAIAGALVSVQNVGEIIEGLRESLAEE